MDGKQDPIHITYKDIKTLRIRGCKKINHADADTSQKKMGMAILTWNKEDFRAKTITRDKEAHFIIIKGSVNEEDITILNVYTPNNRASKYVKQKLIELQGRNRQIPNYSQRSQYLSFNNCYKLKLSKDIVNSNNTIHHYYLIDFSRTLH